MNLGNYTDKDIKNRKTDFDISLAYNMPYIERIIFQYAVYDDCFKEITKYEDANINTSLNSINPKETSELAKDLVRCFVKNSNFEPVCNTPFNNSRECLFRTDLNLALCSNELESFTECRSNPVGYANLLDNSTLKSKSVPHYFSYVSRSINKLKH